MARLSEKAQRLWRDVGIIAGGLAGTFLFLLLLVGFVVGGPILLVFYILGSMGVGTV
jgi:hypothetical protein